MTSTVDESDELRWAMALYDFAGSKKDRTLSFSAGMLVRVDPRTEKDWWPAAVDGHRGFVPRTYVKLHPHEYQPAQQHEGSSGARSSSRRESRSASIQQKQQLKESKRGRGETDDDSLRDGDGMHTTELEKKRQKSRVRQRNDTIESVSTIGGRRRRNETMDSISTIDESRGGRGGQSSKFVSALALYDFEKQEKGQVSFVKGERLRVKPRRTSDWWPAVSLTNERGLVPKNYMRVLTYDDNRGRSISGSRPVSSSDPLSRSIFEGRGGGRENASNPVLKRAASSVRIGERTVLSRSNTHQQLIHNSQHRGGVRLTKVIGQYDFSGSSAHELSFRQGDVLHVEVREGVEWWPAWSPQGQTGLIPQNYVKIIDGGAGDESSTNRANRDRASVNLSRDRGVLARQGMGPRSKTVEGLSISPNNNNRINGIIKPIGFDQGVPMFRSQSMPTDIQEQSDSRHEDSSDINQDSKPKAQRSPRHKVLPLSRWQMLSGNVGLERASFVRGHENLLDIPLMKVLLDDRARRKHNVTQHTVSTITNHMRFMALSDGEIVVTEGSFSHNLYVIVNGSLSMLSGHSNVSTLRVGEWFGESCLLKTHAWPVTVTSCGHSTLLVISADGFSEIATELPWMVKRVRELAFARSASFLRSLPLFAALDEHRLDLLSTLICFEQVKAGEVVYHQSDQAQAFHILLSGQVSVSICPTPTNQSTHLPLSRSGGAGGHGTVGRGASVLFRTLRHKGCFGESVLEKPGLRVETVRADTDVLLASIDGSKFARFISLDDSAAETVLGLLSFRVGRWLNAVPGLQAVSEWKLDKLADLMAYKLFHAGDTLYSVGEKGDVFYLMVSGEIDCTNEQGQLLRTIKRGGFFGEHALAEESPRAETVTCAGASTCVVLALELESFRSFLSCFPEVRSVLLDTVMSRSVSTRVRRRYVNTQPAELAGVQQYPSALFDTLECINTTKTWRSVGIAMAPCLRVLQGWPVYMHPPGGEPLKGDFEFLVTVVGIQQLNGSEVDDVTDQAKVITSARMTAKLSTTVRDVVEYTWKLFPDRLDSVGPAPFALKVASRCDYMTHREAPLGTFKYITRSLRRGMLDGQIELVLVDLRADPKSHSGLLTKLNKNKIVAATRLDSNGQGLSPASSLSHTPTDGSILSRMSMDSDTGQGGGVIAKRMCAIALDDFEHNAVSFKKGARLEVEPQPDEWWPVRTTQGEIGLVPRHILKVTGPVSDNNHNTNNNTNNNKEEEKGKGLRSPTSALAAEPALGMRFSLTRKQTEQRHIIHKNKRSGAILYTGSPLLTPLEWADTVRRATAAALEVPGKLLRVSQSQREDSSALSTYELMNWPVRIQLLGVQKMRTLKRLKKFDKVSVRVELVCGGEVLEVKSTRPFSRTSTLRLDDEWFYFNHFVGRLHSTTRLCFTLVGVKSGARGSDSMNNSSSSQGGNGASGLGGSGVGAVGATSSILFGPAAPLLTDTVDASRVLAGGSLQLFDEVGTLKTGAQTLKLWPEQPGERWYVCQPNPSTTTAELVVKLDEFAQTVFYPMGPPVTVKGQGHRQQERKRRGSALSTEFRVSSSKKSSRKASTVRSGAEGIENEDSAKLSPQVDMLLSQNPIETYRMSSMDKSLLWQARKQLVAIPDALPKLLFSADWTNPKARADALELLREWVAPGPIQAMELLGRQHYDFRVREYAVRCLEAFDDDELGEFLLQLVQVLKYEPYHESPLAGFLLRRALQNPREVGSRLFWGLRAEMHMPQFAVRFGLLLQVYVQSCGRHREELTQQYDVQELLKTVAEKVVSYKAPNKQERTDFCRRKLASVNDKLPRSFSLSLDPRISVCEIVIEKCKVMNSKKKPLWLVLNNLDPPEFGGQNVMVMFKAGDDLRQDQMTLQMLRVMEQIWLEDGLDLRLTPYQCVSTGDELGMLEVVTSAATTAGIHKQMGGQMGALNAKVIHSWLLAKNPDTFSSAVDNFVHSCAGYCVATYVMGIGDRHSDNIMVRESGHLFHIDFGHFLGNFKSKMGLKRERTPFVFTKEMAYVMGGKGEKPYKAFVELCCKAYNILRRHGNELINLFRLMIPAGMPELTCDDDIEYLCAKLHLSKSDEQAADMFKREINVCLNDTYRRLDNLIHNLKQR